MKNSLTPNHFDFGTLRAVAEKPLLNNSYNYIYKLAYSHIIARALHVASYYKLFDVLQDGPKTSLEISSRLTLEPNNLERLLVALVNHDILSINSNKRFSLNSISELLVSTNINSLQPSIAKEFDHKRWTAMGYINLAMEEDLSPFI